ncbi:Uncharacterised protein [Bacteroides xylanisolvens]|nr:Uncharacterised protein [Bacteroides xylanisolvens]
MLLIEMVGKHFLRRPWEARFLPVKAIRSAKIRDVRLRGDPCSAEKYDAVMGCDHSSQFLDVGHDDGSFRGIESK